MKNLLFPVILLLAISCADNKQTVVEWRGPGRTGVYNEKNLLKVWKNDSLTEVLVIPNIGNGFGSPIVTDENIFITGETDSTAILQCFDLSGNRIWQTPLGKEWTESFPGSRSAPTLVDSLLYAGTGFGNLFCIEKNSGHIRWSKDLIRDFHGVHTMFGHAESPAVSGDMVFWTPGGADTNVVALNRFTGDFIWINKGFGERSAYNQPVIISLPDRNILATFSAYHFMGIDCETGELLWSHEQDNYPLDKRAPGYGDTHGNSVIYEDNHLYYAEGDGNCGVRLSLTNGGSVLTEEWRNPGFDSYMGGIVKIGKTLYGCGTVRNQLVSIDAESGVLTDSLKIGRGSIIAADGMLYYYNDRGILNLVSFNQGKMTKISSFRITKGSKEHFSHPVIHKGILYLRHGDVLLGYKLDQI